MAGSYVKDAYKTLYKHDSWEEEARAYEDRLGAMLFKNTYVIDSAQTALARLAKVLNAYYGKTPSKGEQDEILKASVLGSIASDVAGQKSPTDSLVEERETVDTEHEDEVIDSTGDVVSDEDDGRIEVTDTLMHSFLRNAPDSAGQIGMEDESVEGARDRNIENTDAVLNGDGNLREKMTMMFNSTLLNGGRDDEQTSKSASFKHLLRDVSDEDVAENEGLRGLDMDSIKRTRSKGTDVFSIRRLVSKLGNTTIGQKISAFLGSRSRRAKEKSESPLGPGLGYAHYKQLGIKPSKREKRHAVEKSGTTKKLKWREGAAYYSMDKSSWWVKYQAERGRILTAGPSGTAQRMLSAYKFLGASQKELLDFRLALIAWMTTSRDHSLYEIMMGAHTVGVKGKEDLSEAAEMYRTIDPIPTEQLRNDAAVENQFPHERVFKTMLKEVEQARKQEQTTEDRKEDTGKIHQFMNESFEESDYTRGAQELAINIYTTEAYKTQTPSQKYGSFIGKYMMKKRASENSYMGSANDATISEDLRNKIFEVIQIAARIGYEGLDEVGAKSPEGSEDGSAVEFGKMPTTAYKGRTYRGLKMLRLSKKFDSVGNKFAFGAMTSTSKNRSTADGFRGNSSFWRKAVILEIDMQGKSGVDISMISAAPGEDEVLVPADTVFEVTSPLANDRDGKYIAKIKEVSGPTKYVNDVNEIKGQQTGEPVLDLDTTQDEDLLESTGQVMDEDEDDELSQTFVDLIEQRKQMADAGDLREGIEKAMDAITKDPDAMNEFGSNSVMLHNKGFAPKITNWYLACAMQEEFVQALILSGEDRVQDLKSQLTFMAMTHLDMLMKAPNTL